MRKVLPYALNFFFVNQGVSQAKKKKKTRGQTSYLSDCTCISRLQLATKASSILLHSTPKVTHHGPTEWKQKRPLVCTSRSMFYVMWNAWKERKRRTFNETTLTIVLDDVRVDRDCSLRSRHLHYYAIHHKSDTHHGPMECIQKWPFACTSWSFRSYS